MVFGGVTVADSSRAMRVLETSHPPGIYIPPDDIVPGVLSRNSLSSLCEWKGRASYWDIAVGDESGESVAWSYPQPTTPFEPIRSYVSFYPGRVDACYLDDELVTPQEGNFYGGWITAEIVGPFKGAVGTWGW